jgi:hypothetical protein
MIRPIPRGHDQFLTCDAEMDLRGRHPRFNIEEYNGIHRTCCEARQPFTDRLGALAELVGQFTVSSGNGYLHRSPPD